jgi:hypothetical protein
MVPPDAVDRALAADHQSGHASSLQNLADFLAA